MRLIISMKEVDQNTGKDLFPERSKELLKTIGKDSETGRNRIEDIANPMNTGKSNHGALLHPFYYH